MQTKIHNQHGKALQTKACEECGYLPDPSQDYKDWVRSVNTGKNGYWLDIDLIKVRERNGQIYPVAITDLTYAKSHSDAYLNAIKRRWFERDSQGKTFQDMAAFFGIPCFLVAYGDGKVSVLDVNRPDGWIRYTADQWGKVVDEL